MDGDGVGYGEWENDKSQSDLEFFGWSIWEDGVAIDWDKEGYKWGQVCRGRSSVQCWTCWVLDIC